MALKTEKVQKWKNVEEIFVYDPDKPGDEKHKAYRINRKKKEILFYPKDRFFLNEILVAGFDELPDEFSKKGYIQSGLQYYLNKKLESKNVSHLLISKEKKNSFRKYGKKYKVVLNYNNFKQLKKKLSSINYESMIDKSNLVDSFFHQTFPRHFETKVISTKQQTRKVLNLLDESIIEHLDTDDVNILLNFFEAFLKKKYRSSTHKRKLFSSAKIKIDDIAISQIIEEFEKMLSKDYPENKWGDYLQKNIFLVDSKYIHVIPELNVVLASYRKVDFGLVDSQGYMDIFEIKKPTTPLLAKTKDRGNYFWSTDAVKALVQAEKYLYNAERKASVLTEDIKRQKNLMVKVIKPRAIVIMGGSSQLDDDEKQEDFRILRMSLKNIEIVLYDELLERIKIQKNKIYIE